MPVTPMIISICGPSGSGKSLLAKAVAATLGPDRWARIPTDYFLFLPDQPSPGPPTHGLRWDWDLLDGVLSEPAGAVVTTPNVDFDRLVRRAPSGGLAFVVRPIMLTDALTPHPRAAFRVRLTAPESIRRARLADRDTVWKSHVLDRWTALEQAWDETLTTQNSWDLDLSGEEPIERNAARVAEAWLTRKR